MTIQPLPIRWHAVLKSAEFRKYFVQGLVTVVEYLPHDVKIVLFFCLNNFMQGVLVLWHSPIVSFLLELKLFCFQKGVKLVVLRVDVVLLHLVNKLGDGTAGTVPIEVEFLQDNF